MTEHTSEPAILNAIEDVLAELHRDDTLTMRELTTAFAVLQKTRRKVRQAIEDAAIARAACENAEARENAADPEPSLFTHETHPGLEH